MKSIIFNQHQVNHALKNKEGMFRVVCKVQPINDKQKLAKPLGLDCLVWIDPENIEDVSRDFKMPFEVGETIFVKERARSGHETKGGLKPWYGVVYEAGGYKDFYGEKNQPNFPNMIFKLNGELRFEAAAKMPQWASRLTLRIKSVKVERLTKISEDDCWKEGCEEFADYQDVRKVCEMAKQIGDCIEDPRPYFAVYWNSTHKKPEEKWEASPWIFAYEYEVVR